MKTQHTPGPWQWAASTAGTQDDVYHVGAEYEPHGDICTIAKQDPQQDGGRSRALELANARLIAAAPELLAALYNLTMWIEGEKKGYNAKELSEVSLQRHIEVARAALAKATGRFTA